jgi:hypothetical protein
MEEGNRTVKKELRSKCETAGLRKGGKLSEDRSSYLRRLLCCLLAQFLDESGAACRKRKSVNNRRDDDLDSLPVIPRIGRFSRDDYPELPRFDKSSLFNFELGTSNKVGTMSTAREDQIHREQFLQIPGDILRGVFVQQR